jgi:hypothetical protein
MTLGPQLVVAADNAASQVGLRFGVMVPPLFMPKLLQLLALGPLRP